MVQPAVLLWFLAAGALSALLSACAVPPVVERGAQEQASLWAARIGRLQHVTRWRMEARVAVRQGDEGWQASLHWVQLGSRTRIELFDPVGRRVARLDGDASGVRLVARGQPARWARSPEALMQAVLGWSLPVEGMRWWLLGVPDPALPVAALELDGQGRARRFSQAGWELRYRQYERWDGEDLPVRAEFSQASLRVRVLVTSWSLS
ncbi:MAG TPA: outer membrane lipoprotein LolB [Chromatiales bacterium]|nr:outer membrane lipoprotein LolB [Chromatiales bacterium]